MHPKSPKLLDDVVRSCRYIMEDTASQTLEDFLADRRTRQAVERNLLIIGEALVRLRNVDPETASRITDLQQVIGLRNRLAHGYDEEIDETLVWRSICASLPTLHAETEALLPEFER